jgi:succinate dehydrogenase / fumarate reductase cytochrome b subunit
LPKKTAIHQAIDRNRQCRGEGKGRNRAMPDVNRGNRPLSPHLQIYRPQLTMVTSILTRITGNGLIVGTLLIIWWLLAAATGPEYFAVADGVLRSWFGKLVMFGSIWALWYHALAGLRHLYYDSGRGLDIGTAEKLGWAVIVGSVLLTLLTVILF